MERRRSELQFVSDEGRKERWREKSLRKKER